MRNLVMVGLAIAVLIVLNELRFLHGRSTGLAMTIIGLSIVTILQGLVLWNFSAPRR